MKKILIVLLFNCSFSQAQTFNIAALNDLNFFFEDAVLFSDRYITPATDAAVYQAASAWISSAKKSKKWSTNIGIHTNLFIVPKEDRTFNISNDDFNYLTIRGANSAVVPTALGDDYQVIIDDIYTPNGLINPAKPIKTPQGVNQENIFYPHLSGSVCVGSGTEFIGKFAPKVKIKKGEYQVYGFGVKHNIDQYIQTLQKSKINLAASLVHSKEIISFDFLNVQPTPYGTLGIDKITGKVNSIQLQINASKEWRNFEFMIGSITNLSEFEYFLTGETGTIEEFIPVQQILNDRLKEIYKSKINSIIEISTTYKLRRLHFQSAIAFSKFLNANLSVHYKIN